MRLSGRKSSALTQPWTQRQRVALVSVIVANIGAFVVERFLQAQDHTFARDYLGLSSNGISSAYAWQFLTSIFLHDGFFHFAVNVLVLYLVGRDVESIIGQRNFLLLYFGGAFVGELGHLFVMPPDTVLFGASGGVVAVLFAYATILPELEISSAPSLRFKAKHVAYAAIAIAILLLVIDRRGTITHSCYLGACFTGWLYAHLLGFGRPSFVQRALRQRRAARERYREMTADEFIAEEIDPLLDKISRSGMASLTRRERRVLAKAREKLMEEAPAH